MAKAKQDDTTAEADEAAKLEAERAEAERAEAERVEAERVEAERVEAERVEAERVEAAGAAEKLASSHSPEFQIAALARFDRAFCHDLPSDAATKQHARGGAYHAAPGDRFDAETYPIAAGRYRVGGSDWVHEFSAGRYRGSVRADPPDFGGAGVKRVAA